MAAVESGAQETESGPPKATTTKPRRGRDLAGRKVAWYLPRDIRFRRHLRFTREGKLFVFVTLGLGFAAVNTGTNLMYLVFGFMLSLIVLSGVLSEHVLRDLAVERRLPQRAVAGEPTLIELSVKNRKKRLVSYSVEVEDQAEGADNPRRCYFLKIPPNGEQAASYRRVPERRGVLYFRGFSVATRFPFALFEKWRELDLAGELLIFPKPLPMPLPQGMYKERGERGGSARGRGSETRELRDYRQDDEMRMIHWRRSASLGKPVVRELEQEASSLFSIRLDNYRAPTDGDDWLTRFEENVSRAAYLVERGLARGYAVEICARGTRSRVATAASDGDMLQRFLALLESVDERHPLALPTRGARVVDLSSYPEPAAQAS
ncbi:MAG TPA: DUF58 domain-containing protein [Polyangiales bacterium]